MQESYKYQVNCRGDGVVFEMDPNQSTLFDMMRVICDYWLDEYRNGDGGIDYHLWKFTRPEPEMPAFLKEAEEREYQDEDSDDDDDDDSDDSMPQWTEEQRQIYLDYCIARSQSQEALPTNTTLKTFDDWWQIGTSASAQYDFGSTTYFDVRLVSKDNISKDIQLPRLSPDEADELAKTFKPFVPQEGSPNMNDVFPHANRMMFQLGSKWLCPYPSSSTSGGFVEGISGDSDLIFIPEPFESLQHALIGIDRAAEECPDKSGFSRMVFPMDLSSKANDYYTKSQPLVQEYLDFLKNVDHQRSLRTVSGAMDMNAVSELSENIQYRLFCPQSEFYYRLTTNDVKKFESSVIHEIFPLCAKAYKQGLWASYHRGKVKICKGEDSGERGVPKTLLRQVTYQVNSLHEFFCVAEALFQIEQNNSVFSALKKTVEMDPNLINGKVKANNNNNKNRE
eukprot:scaffold1209_cov136-Cylindrotheca_fusiformis.AAC.2